MPAYSKRKVDARVDHRIHYTFLDYQSQALRRAVLFPLYGPQGLKQSIEHLHRLRKWWWRRLYELQKAGCPWLRTSKQVCYTGNCRFFGVRLVRPGTDTCKRARICPFCRARRLVAPSWRKVRAWYDAAEPEALRVTPFEFLWRLQPEKGVEVFESGQLCVRKTLQQLSQRSRAGVAVADVLPSDRVKQPDMVVIRLRGLALGVAPAVGAPGKMLKNWQPKEVLVRTLAELALQVGKAFAYPKPLLAHQDVELVELILQRTRSWRQLRSWGKGVTT